MAQKGRIVETEEALEKLWGTSHVKSAVAELSKSDRGDELDKVKFSELFYGRHVRGTIIIQFFKVIFINLCQEVINLVQLLFCSGIHWVCPVFFATIIWYKCCILFLVDCL